MVHSLGRRSGVVLGSEEMAYFPGGLDRGLAVPSNYGRYPSEPVPDRFAERHRSSGTGIHCSGDQLNALRARTDELAPVSPVTYWVDRRP